MRLGDNTPPYQLQSESKNVNMHVGNVCVNVGSKVETPNTKIQSYFFEIEGNLPGLKQQVDLIGNTVCIFLVTSTQTKLCGRGLLPNSRQAGLVLFLYNVRQYMVLNGPYIKTSCFHGDGLVLKVG